MATLKISDLSVGDWVQNDYGDYVKVEGIWQGYNSNYQVDIFCDGKIATILPCHLHPIPITAKILEANGFERSTCQFIVYHTDKVWISYDKPSETWSVTMYINDVTSNLRANILHIHQLQHALRLAGVDKEVNL